MSKEAYEPVIVPYTDSETENKFKLKGIRDEYDRFTRAGEVVSQGDRQVILNPRLAYRCRELGGRVTDETPVTEVFTQLTESIQDDATERQFARLTESLNSPHRGNISTVGEVRNTDLQDLLAIRTMGGRMAMFLKVAFAKINEDTSA